MRVVKGHSDLALYCFYLVPGGVRRRNFSAWGGRQKSWLHVKGEIYMYIYTQSRLTLSLTLCDSMDCNPPGFSVHEVFQARILEWIAISSSRGSFWSRDWAYVSWVSSLAGEFFTSEPPGKPRERERELATPPKPPSFCQSFIIHAWPWRIR